jgi:hypothetical protein
MAGHTRRLVATLAGAEEQEFYVGENDHASLEAHASIVFNREYERLVKEGWQQRNICGNTVTFRKGGGVISLTYLGG